MGMKTCIGNGTALIVMLREESSRVLIGAAGTWRSDWRRWDVGVLIGQSACRLLALAREEIDSTRACASGSLHSAAITTLWAIYTTAFAINQNEANASNSNQTRHYVQCIDW